jgi:hypothetical protein
MEPDSKSPKVKGREETVVAATNKKRKRVPLLGVVLIGIVTFGVGVGVGNGNIGLNLILISPRQCAIPHRLSLNISRATSKMPFLVMSGYALVSGSNLL